METKKNGVALQGRSHQQTIVCYSNDTWESALSRVRLCGPLAAAGFWVVPGNVRDQNLVDRLADVDYVVIQRDFPQYVDLFFHVLEETRRYQIPLIYEIDDLLFYLPESHPLRKEGRYSKYFLPMLMAVCRADLVTASTEPLAGFLRPFNSNVRVLSNYLNEAYWHFLPIKEIDRKDSPVVIGYIGGSTHYSDIEMIIDALKEIHYQFGRKVMLRFFGAEPPHELLSLFKIDWQPVVADYKEYAGAFGKQKVDILIAPLEDNLFNQSKSHLKYLEYSTLGVPGVYSKVRPYTGIVEHGVNGFLASSEEEWVDCLRTLISSPELRRQMAGNAQETVKKEFLLSEHAHEWAEAYGTIGDITSKYQAASSYDMFKAQEAMLETLYRSQVEPNQHQEKKPQPHPQKTNSSSRSIRKLWRLIAWEFQRFFKKHLHKGH